MFLHKVDFKNWKFQVDLELTKKSFEIESKGSADDCNCGFCENFRHQRENVYPTEIKALFENLGIDVRKETEVSEVCRLENGLIKYFGSFNFAGEITSDTDTKNGLTNEIKLSPITDNFSIGFSKMNDSFVTVYFETNIPSILKDFN